MRYRLPLFVVRPSILIGHSETGQAIGWNGYYAVVRALHRVKRAAQEADPGSGGRRLRVLANPAGRINLVPIDYVVRALWHVARSERQNLFIFNVTSGKAITVAQGFASLCQAVGLTSVELLDARSFYNNPMTGAERLFSREAKFQLRYLADDFDFDQTNFRKVVPRAILNDPEVGERVLHRINARCVSALESHRPPSRADWIGTRRPTG